MHFLFVAFRRRLQAAIHKKRELFFAMLKQGKIWYITYFSINNRKQQKKILMFLFLHKYVVVAVGCTNFVLAAFFAYYSLENVSFFV